MAPQKEDKVKILTTNGSLMKVESIEECSCSALVAFCNTFDLYLAINGLKNQFLVLLRVAVLHRFYCTCYLVINLVHTGFR